MQRTLITRKNWICEYYDINWMNSKKSEAVVRRFSVKKVFLKISQNSQKNTATLLKKRLWYRCFPFNLAKFLIIPFFIKHLWWLSKTASVKYEYAVNARFTQGLLQLLFTFFD